MGKTIETERLILSPWTNSEEDVAELFAYAKNPNVGPHAGWAPHKTIEESRRIVEEIFLKEENAWAIRDKATGKIIGSISLFEDTAREGVASREIGYNLAEECWGKGYMTEAAKAVIEFGFREKDLVIIAVRTSAVNIRSQRVVEKCGFTYEGTLRKTYRIYDGTDRDSRFYSILREEWEKTL